MNISPDDPKLTAYALGELPETEAREIERELEKSAELREAVKDIRLTADLLKNEFVSEPALKLSQQGKDSVIARTEVQKIVPLRSRTFWATAGIGAIAATILILLALQVPDSNKTPQFVKNDRKEEVPAVTPLMSKPVDKKEISIPVEEPAELQPAPVTVTVEDQILINQPVPSSLPAGVGGNVEGTVSLGSSVLSGAPIAQANPTDRKPQIETYAFQNRGSISGDFDFKVDAAEKVVSSRGLAITAGKPAKRSVSLGGVYYGIAPKSSPSAYGLDVAPGQSESLAATQQPQSQAFNLPRVLLADAGNGGSKYSREGSGLNYVTKTNPTREINDNVRHYFESSGVKLDPQEGRNVFLNDRSGKLFVRASGSEMKKVESALESLGVAVGDPFEESEALMTRTYDVDPKIVSRFAPGEDPETAARRAKVSALKELAELQNKYTEGHPKVVRLKQRIQELDHRLKPHDTARYPEYIENAFEPVLQNPLSTFSIDVDTASYANVRRFLNEGRMPPHDAVRIEEMINYFSYDYPQPKGEEPFSANIEVAGCPWDADHRLVRVGLKGREIAENKRPPSNFVFLLDVSGSMSPTERLPLIKQALRMLVKRMTENDRIAIVVYASSSGVVLESTSCVNKEKILEALDRLEAGGSTNGGAGIQRAYSLAEEHFIKGGVNRVILCTDGDFNVGITDQGDLLDLIQRKAKSGVFLSALGVGTDNYKDALLQKLADKGNGNYHYIDTMEEAHKVLVQQMNGTLVTIAKDVKIQIEFNPAQVGSYRLIGYEKRMLEAEDFNNDKKDAGEIGAGHTVTALYEIVPAGAEADEPRVVLDDLKYQSKPAVKPVKREVFNDSKELLTLKLRWKKPDGDKSQLTEVPVTDSGKKFNQASTDFKFAAVVASFGMMLKDSEYKGSANFGSVLELAQKSKGDDKEGYRAEFINLVKKAKELKNPED